MSVTPPEGASTFSAGDRSAQLDLIAKLGACEADRVILLDFGVIRDRVGQRWESKRESVWAQVERTIARHVSPHSIVCRVDQTEYVICFAEEKGFGAHAIGFRIIEDVLTFFLGQCSADDMIVRSVSSISEGEIIASTVVCQPEHLIRNSRPTEMPAAHVLAGTAPSMTAIVEDRVHLTCSIEDVVNLKTDIVAGERIGVRFFDLMSHRVMTDVDQAALPTRILVTCDLHMFSVLDWLIGQKSSRLVIAPVSIQTFGSSKSRSIIFERLHAISPRERSRLIIELTGLEVGTLASRMTEAMTLLKPFCRSVMARTTPGRTGLVNARLARLPAISINASQLGGDGARLAAGLLAFGTVAKVAAPTLMAAELPNEGFLSVCIAAGFTHATVQKS